jgi:hypothetical protein
MSFGLLSYFFPLFPLLRPLFPVLHSPLSQVISRVVFPSKSWPSFRSCCVWFPFLLYMFVATLSFGILSTCPNQLNLLLLMCLTIFSYLIAFSSSSFVLSLHSQSAFCVGPNILLSILLSNTNNFCLIFSVKVQQA